MELGGCGSIFPGVVSNRDTIKSVVITYIGKMDKKKNIYFHFYKNTFPNAPVNYIEEECVCEMPVDI